MLIRCPEKACPKKVSEKAMSCPECGYVLTDLDRAKITKNKSFSINSKVFVLLIISLTIPVVIVLLFVAIGIALNPKGLNNTGSNEPKPTRTGQINSIIL